MQHGKLKRQWPLFINFKQRVHNSLSSTCNVQLNRTVTAVNFHAVWLFSHVVTVLWKTHTICMPPFSNSPKTKQSTPTEWNFYHSPHLSWDATKHTGFLHDKATVLWWMTQCAGSLFLSDNSFGVLPSVFWDASILHIWCHYGACTQWLITHPGIPDSTPGQSMWDPSWAEWQWNRFFSDLVLPVGIITIMLHTHLSATDAIQYYQLTVILNKTMKLKHWSKISFVTSQ
jgi:hypothetical protein